MATKSADRAPTALRNAATSAGAPPHSEAWKPISTFPGWGWAAYILPYVEQEPLYRRIDFATAIEAYANKDIRTTILKIYTCPSDLNTGIYVVDSQRNEPLADAATNSYAACYGSGGSIGEFPRILKSAASLREPHRVCRYLEDLAGDYHRFYDSCRVLPQGDEAPGDLHAARLALCAATRQVIANGLQILGVTAPERM